MDTYIHLYYCVAFVKYVLFFNKICWKCSWYKRITSVVFTV